MEIYAFNKNEKITKKKKQLSVNITDSILMIEVFSYLVAETKD
jgi:hypothetical protein